MIKKTLVYLILGIMLAFVNQAAIAKEKTADTTYHFIFKLQDGVSTEGNELIIEAFRKKMDILAIDKCIIKPDGNLFIVTTKTDLEPEKIIAEIRSDKLLMSLTFVANFVCDVAKNKEHFLGEVTSTEIPDNTARYTVGGIIVEPQKNDYKNYIPEEE
jgi:hypothetical protein